MSTLNCTCGHLRSILLSFGDTEGAEAKVNHFTIEGLHWHYLTLWGIYRSPQYHESKIPYNTEVAYVQIQPK